MGSLVSRPRVRRIVERVARRGLRAVGALQDPAPAATTREPLPSPEPPPRLEPPPQPEPSPVSYSDFLRDVGPGVLSADGCAVSRLLFERLSAEDVVAVERGINETPELAAQYSAAPDDASRRYLLLAFGAWLSAPPVVENSNLGTAQPPEDVHAMARGPLAAAGGMYEADLVADALASAGVEITSLSSGLDFGCSSGRVVSVLAAAYPEINWHGCDPNTRAVTWAAENHPKIDFFVNGDAPPLDLEDGSLDLVFAISIWSHFAPELGLRWFDEMYRVVRHGGHLVCTTHGLTSVSLYAQLKLRMPGQLREIADSLYRHGWWYAPEFGEDGDWGVVNSDWGTAFLSPEWMLAQLCPRWRVLEFAPGRNQGNQDVYVLERV